MTSGAGGRVAEPVGGGVLLWPLSWGGSRRPPVLPPSRPSFSRSASAESVGPALASPVPEPSRPVPGDVEGSAADGASEAGAEPPRRFPSSAPSLGGCGSRDCSGATSSSMASNTDVTCSLTSPSCTGSRSRRLPQVSRWAREKEESACMGPSESGLRS